MTEPGYLIVVAESVLALTDTVNEHMRDGWEPVGGLTYKPPVAPMSYPVINGTMHTGHIRDCWAQAMVRSAKEEK